MNAPKSDKNYVFDSEKGRTVYSFSGENLYENSKNLGVYHMEGDGRVLEIDENKNIYDPKSNSKSIDSYMFDENIGSVVKLEHENGVCAAYSNGESIDLTWLQINIGVMIGLVVAEKFRKMIFLF